MLVANGLWTRKYPEYAPIAFLRSSVNHCFLGQSTAYDSAVLSRGTLERCRSLGLVPRLGRLAADGWSAPDPEISHGKGGRNHRRRMRGWSKIQGVIGPRVISTMAADALSPVSFSASLAECCCSNIGAIDLAGAYS